MNTYIQKIKNSAKYLATGVTLLVAGCASTISGSSLGVEFKNGNTAYLANDGSGFFYKVTQPINQTEQRAAILKINGKIIKETDLEGITDALTNLLGSVPDGEIKIKTEELIPKN